MTSTDTQRSWLGTADAGNYVGVSSATMRRWRKEDLGPRSYMVGKDIRYDIADLDAWLEVQKLATARGGVA